MSATSTTNMEYGSAELKRTFDADFETATETDLETEASVFTSVSCTTVCFSCDY